MGHANPLDAENDNIHAEALVVVDDLLRTISLSQAGTARPPVLRKEDQIASPSGGLSAPLVIGRYFARDKAALAQPFSVVFATKHSRMSGKTVGSGLPSASSLINTSCRSIVSMLVGLINRYRHPCKRRTAASTLAPIQGGIGFCTGLTEQEASSSSNASPSW